MIDAPPPRRIAVVRFSSLGDLILTLPALKILRERFPLASIDLIVKRQYAAVFDSCPSIDGVIPFDKTAADSTSPFGDLVRTVRSSRYDLLLDWHGTLRSRSLSILGGARRVIRFRKGSLRRRFLVATKIRIGEFPRTAERYARTIPGWQCGSPLPGPILTLQEQERSIAGDLLEQSLPPGNGPLIGFAPGARHATKRWPAERFADLAESIQASIPAIRGIVLFGDESERTLAESIRLSGSSRSLNLAGKLTIRQTAAVMAHCHLLVSNDTGLMHLATAVAVPVIALFGPTSREFGFFPMGEHNRVIEQPLPCRPCSLHGSAICPIGTHACMTSIGVERIVTEIDSVLSRV